MLVSLERQLLLERIPASARHVGLGRRHIARQEEITPGTKARCFDRQPPSTLVCNTRPSPEVCTRRLENMRQCTSSRSPTHGTHSPNSFVGYLDRYIRYAPCASHNTRYIVPYQSPLRCNQLRWCAAVRKR